MMINKRMRITKHNNKGSTFAIVLVLLTFVAVLSVLVMSASLTNLKMKLVNKNADKTFYTSEDAVAEVYVALGKVSMDCFSSAYTEELSMVQKNIYDASTNTYVYNAAKNIECNEKFRVVFAKKILSTFNTSGQFNTNGTDRYQDNLLGIYNGNSQDVGNFVTLMNSFIEDSESNRLKIESVGDVHIEKNTSSIHSELNNFVLKFTDCVVGYIDQNSYYSYITYNGQIAMPDRLIDFVTSESKGLTEFTEYSLIGNRGILQQSGKGLINGNAYAGASYGLTTGPSTSLTVRNGTFVTSGNIMLKDQSTLNARSMNLWCKNLLVQGNDSAMKIDNYSNTYVSDDLQVDGNNSTVNVSGNYYGYGYEGENYSGNHENSSAIILNGKNSNLDFSKITTLVVSGKAYIDYTQKMAESGYMATSLCANGTGTFPYMTADSISMIGTQELYLVPVNLMNHAVSNPVVGDTSDISVSINNTTFFGYPFLNGTTPYTTRTVDGKTYYYLNFTNTKTVQNYLKALYDDDFYNKTIAGITGDDKVTCDRSREYVKSVVTVNISELESCIQMNPTAQIHTNGALLAVMDPDHMEEYSAVFADNEYGYKDLKAALSTRFTLLRKVLLESYEEDTDGYIEDDIFTNIIDKTKLNTLTNSNAYKNVINDCLLYGIRNEGKPLIISDDPSDIVNASKGNPFVGINKGVIVATGDVLVKKNFNGCIISNGKITIDGNVTVSSSITGISIESLIASDDNYATIFKSCSAEGTGSVLGDSLLGSLTYKDLVTFSDWSKN
jgi:hypothetical protein